MKRTVFLLFILILVSSVLLAGCRDSVSGNDRKSIVVTYSVLGSIVKDLAGDKAEVIVSIPNGLNVHEWEPSARDIEKLNNADLIVRNGLQLEAGMEKTLNTAAQKGIPIFTASEHITVRYIGENELTDNDHELEETHHHETGAADPHLWTDPLTMKSIVEALSVELKNTLDIDVSGKAAELIDQLVNLHEDIQTEVTKIPENKRMLVTGHHSMGYFARRYDFKVIGAIIPSISTQAQVSAGELAELKELIKEHDVDVVFTEVGTKPKVAETIANETGARAVELNTHILPGGDSYFSLMREITDTIVGALE
jgi:zinc/manganese transport system substrate-binding protein